MRVKPGYHDVGCYGGFPIVELLGEVSDGADGGLLVHRLESIETDAVQPVWTVDVLSGLLMRVRAMRSAVAGSGRELPGAPTLLAQSLRPGSRNRFDVHPAEATVLEVDEGVADVIQLRICHTTLPARLSPRVDRERSSDYE